MQHLKMWSLSSSRCICLLTLAAVLLISATQVDSYVPFVGLSCCRNVSSRQIRAQIKSCYEQKPRDDCNSHAFLITTKRNKQWCVNPDAIWLQDKIEKGKLDCPPELGFLDGVEEVDEA